MGSGAWHHVKRSGDEALELGRYLRTSPGSGVGGGGRSWPEHLVSQRVEDGPPHLGMVFVHISIRLDETGCAGRRVGTSPEIGGIRTEAYKGGERCGFQQPPGHSGEMALDGWETRIGGSCVGRRRWETRMGGSCMGRDARLGVHPS